MKKNKIKLLREERGLTQVQLAFLWIIFLDDFIIHKDGKEIKFSDLSKEAQNDILKYAEFILTKYPDETNNNKS